MAKSWMKDVSKLLDQVSIDSFLSDLGLRRRQGPSSGLSMFGVFIAGAAVGAVLGILYAPKPGRDLREDISRRTATLRDQVSERVQSVAKKGERYNPPS